MRVDLCRIEVDVHDGYISIRIPSLRVIFRDIVSYGKYEITLFHSFEDIIFKSQSNAEQGLVRLVRYGSLPHKCGYNGDVVTGCKFCEVLTGQFSDGTISCKNQWFLCRREQCECFVNRFVIGCRTSNPLRRSGCQAVRGGVRGGLAEQLHTVGDRT